MKRKIVKSFDLEAFKNGAKVETRNGHKVEILRTDLKNNCPIIGIVTGDDGSEGFSMWKTDGVNPVEIIGDNDNDLVIVDYENDKSEDEKVHIQMSAADRGIVDEIIFALKTFGEEKMISYDKEIEWLNQLRKL